jgi:hypothetical protein
VNDAWIVWTFLGVGAVVVSALFVVAAAKRRLVAVAGSTLVAAACAWLVALAAIGSDAGDADGFVDCRNACTVVHYATAFAFVGGPIFAVLGAAGLVVGAVHLRRTGTTDSGSR